VCDRVASLVTGPPFSILESVQLIASTNKIDFAVVSRSSDHPARVWLLADGGGRQYTEYISNMLFLKRNLSPATSAGVL